MEAEFKESKTKPLTIELETAKGMVLTAVNRAKQECGIPNFIMEGIIADIHSQVMSQAKIELLNDINLYIKEKEEKEEKEGEE
nr:MAG TPA: hypothetical protein [Herelleviridae sp.]